ncbi:fimbria/pilus outer membrane usher protein [Pseudoalteromonas sp. P1-25]|uniref:fimbria/pilus outer membrane usher protein n=1 Tax=Pseudoalteromonas sp. P1-25 TaxID=1723758 RepID=UPI0006D66C21|nr:fimbria/pilus outer membrane usher protein [Pseudoalteromonas sp. P1-25]KPZ57809.1 Fimbrial Usher protein [Pseudoalteromonas sp. P1-25]
MKITAAFLFAMFFFPLTVFSKINPSNRTIELNVSAQLNKSPIGQVLLKVDKDDALFLKWNELEPHFRQVLLEEKEEELFKVLKGSSLAVTSLKELGFSVVFDMSDFSLDIIVPVELTRPQKLSAQKRRKKLKAIEPAKASGFVNAYASYVHQDDQEQQQIQEQYALRSEIVASWQGWVVENELEYNKISQPSSSIFKRRGTRLIHDLPNLGMRLSIGDNFSSGGYFQNSSRLLGFSLAHDFSLLSDRPIRPTASQSFTLQSPSSVEVYVDGRIIQRLNLVAGIYSLDDIPISEGSNNIFLKITDIAGVVRYVNFDVATGLDLFAKGQLEYEIHLGVPAQAGDRLKYEENAPFLSAYLDYGLTPSWTAGFTVQGDKYAQQIGTKQIYAAKVGQLAFEGALSFAKHQGYAYRTIYSSYNMSNLGSEFTFGYEYTSRYFTALGFRTQEAFNNRYTEHYAQASYSYYVNSRTLASFFANISRDHEGEQFDQSMGLNISGDLANSQWRYTAGAQWDDLRGEKQWGLSLSLTYKFNNQHRIKLSHRSKRDKTRLEFTQDSNQRFVGALNLRAGLENNDLNKTIFDLNMQYNANRFAANLEHASFYKDLNARSAYHQSRLSVASSVAFADDTWAFGKPIYDSFALVNAHKSLENKVITLGRVEDEYRADNSDFKTILLNDLSSYDSINIPVDIDDLAPGYDIGSGMLSFYPQYKTGHKAIIGTAANISVIATLRSKDEAPLALMVGKATCSSDASGKEYTFFTNKRGRFAITGLAPCRYEVTLQNKDNTKFFIDVRDAEQLQRKGVIYVH